MVVEAVNKHISDNWVLASEVEDQPANIDADLSGVVTDLDGIKSELTALSEQMDALSALDTSDEMDATERMQLANRI